MSVSVSSRTRMLVLAIVSAAAVAALAVGLGPLADSARADQALPVCTHSFAPDFSATPNPALVGHAINFNGSCSEVPCPGFGSFPTCPPQSYSWQLGDGTTASTPTVSHSYAAAGTYTVVLTVTDYNTDSFTVSHQVTILAAP